MASNPKRIRDYAKEYLIRIARGLAGGKSRSQARGHARAIDLPSSTSSQPFKRSEPLEDALKLMKKGVSQKEAAKRAGVSAETLRRFQKANTTSQRKGQGVGELTAADFEDRALTQPAGTGAAGRATSETRSSVRGRGCDCCIRRGPANGKQ